MLCVWCGKELIGKQTRFCCYLCNQKWKAKNNWRRNVDKQRKPKPCSFCGREYPGTKDQQFCSYECANTSRQKEWDKTSTCPQCNKVFEVSPHHALQIFCSKMCANESRKRALGTPPPNTAERKITRSGYVWIHAPSYCGANKKGCVAEHKVVAEQKIGRRLQKNEVVHHINRVRWDNRPENLEVMSRKAHSLLHRELERTERQKYRDGARLV